LRQVPLAGDEAVAIMPPPGESMVAAVGTVWVESVTVVVTLSLLVGAVLLHYEALTVIGRLLKTRVLHHRVKILALVFALITVHVLDIVLFALGYLFLSREPGFGTILPWGRMTFADFAYFSAITYTTVGYGDFVPTGAIRFLCGVEALAGFVLITWSASFMFIEMQRYWGRD
jgi:hypothetical protein